MKQAIRKSVQLLSYYILPLIVFALWFFAPFEYGQMYWLFDNTGVWSYIILCVIVFASPLFSLFPSCKVFSRVMGYRRELGVLSFWFAFQHSVWLFFDMSLLQDNFFSLLSDLKWHVSWGLFGFFLMSILGLTSNKISQLKLKKKWKKLQYLTYPAFIFISVHYALAERENHPYIILGAYVFLKLVEFWKKKKRKKSL